MWLFTFVVDPRADAVRKQTESSAHIHLDLDPPVQSCLCFRHAFAHTAHLGADFAWLTGIHYPLLSPAFVLLLLTALNVRVLKN